MATRSYLEHLNEAFSVGDVMDYCRQHLTIITYFQKGFADFEKKYVTGCVSVTQKCI
jgi:hypothetical protein